MWTRSRTNANALIDHDQVVQRRGKSEFATSSHRENEKTTNAFKSKDFIDFLVHAWQYAPWDFLPVFFPVLAILPHALFLIPHLSVDE